MVRLALNLRQSDQDWHVNTDLHPSSENCLLSELQFLCPHTNRPVGTGMRTDHRTIAAAGRRGCVMHLPCSNCGMGYDLDLREGMLSRLPQNWP